MKKVLPFIIVPILIMVGVVLYVSSELKNKPAQSHRTYTLNVKDKPNKIELNKPTKITYMIKNDRRKVIKKFSLTHEKIMHLIIVRKDLTHFQHLHPTFNKETGAFTVDVTLTADGPYRFFADFTPADSNPQKLPVAIHDDFIAGDLSAYKPETLTVDTKTEKTVGEYLITYALPQDIQSQKSFTYSLTVTQNGEPITLEPYLGALGHSVVLREGTLDYIHTHAGEHKSAEAEHGEHEVTNPNEINFSTTFPEPGKYKMFTQFQHEGKVFTADYTLEIK